MRRSLVAHALGFIAALLVLVACVGDDPVSSPPGADAGPPDALDGGPPADSGAPCDPVTSDDFAGCACAGAAVRDCSHARAITPPSACGKGSQRCENGRWSPCTPTGASPLDPKGPEVCFDALDDDCDGKLDDGCPGSGDVDTCTSGGAERPSPTAFTDKASYKRGETIQLFVLWKQGTIGSVQLQRTSGGTYCAGGGGGKDYTADPGKGCVGWSMHRRTIDTNDTGLLPGGASTIEVLINAAASPACTGAAAKATTIITVN